MNSINIFELSFVFFKMGSVAYGGWSGAYILVKRELVEKRKWITEKDLDRSLTYSQLLPGATAIGIIAGSGYRIRGWLGLAIATISYLFVPATFMLLLSILYFRFHNLAILSAPFNGMYAVLVGILLANIYNLLQKYNRHWFWWAITIAALLATFIFHISHSSFLDCYWRGFTLSFPTSHICREKQMNLLWDFFLRVAFISIINFGGGAQALFENMAVQQTGWLTAQDFASGLSLAFTTPGPNIFITPVFIGYAIAGFIGALVGLVGAFLAPALLAGLTLRYLEPLLHHPLIKSFESGARSAIIGLLLITTFNIYEQVDLKWIYSIFTLIAFYLSVKKISPPLLLIGGAVLGFTINLLIFS